MRDKQARRNKIAAAKRELKKRAEERLATEQEKRGEAAADGRSYTPRGQAKEAEPQGSDQVNFTDPESRIMLSGTEVVQGYNAQAAIDADTHVVLAAGVSNRAADMGHLPELISEVIKTAGAAPAHVSADAGYYSARNVAAVGATALIAPDKIRRKEWYAQQAPKGRTLKGLPLKDRMRRRLATKAGKRLYLQRQASVEPLFGNTKQNRGLRQFLHRGLALNHHLFRFDMAVHNLLKIAKELRQRLTRAAAGGHQPTRRREAHGVPYSRCARPEAGPTRTETRQLTAHWLQPTNQCAGRRPELSMQPAS